MPNYAHPGLYFLEQSGQAPVQGNSTTIPAFLGIAPKGEVSKAVLVSSWTQFQKLYGGFYASSYLAYAVRGFFENGGSQCYVVRVVKYTSNTKQSVVATKTLQGSGAVDSVKFDAKSDGVWGNNITVSITSGSIASTYNVIVKYSTVTVETFSEVSQATIEGELANSDYIKATALSTSVIPTAVADQALVNGADGISTIADSDYVGNSSDKNGLYALDGVNIDLVAIPGVTTSTVVSGIKTYVENRGDCFGVLDTPISQLPTAGSVVTYANTTVALVSDACGMFYPWLKVSDPIGAGKVPTKLVPPSGHICGIIAKVDGDIGVWKAPAGVESQLNGVLALEYVMSDSEQDVINPANINAIRQFDGSGILVWGSRTRNSTGGFKYIPVRRTMLYVKKALRNSLNWAVFKPNNEVLWGNITANVSSFLSKLRAQGALKGASDAEAFFVKCDAENNTADTIDLGFTYVDIGLAIVKPTEFVVFRLSLTR